MKKSLSVTLGAAFLVTVLLISSCASPSLQKADEAKKNLQYKYAADLYTYLAPKIKDKKEQQRAREEAGYCYRMANEFDKAIKSYEKVVKKDPKNTEALYQLGVLNLKVAGDDNKTALKESREWLTKYLNEVPNDERALKKIAAIDSTEVWKKEAPNSRFKVTNFKIVNTKQMEYSPMIASKKDDVLYFSTDREGGASKKRIWATTGNSFSDLWFVKAKKGKRNAPMTWEKPVWADGTINTRFNDGSCVFDRKYATIYYTQCNGADGKSNACKIYTAKLVDGKWSEEQMLGFCANDTFDYGHPAISEDGKTLYFSSNRPDGEGGYDIWCVTYNQRAKSWGTPFNLGNVINTESDEMFPAYNIHDQMLYFSSNGHIGMGAMDIFRVEGAGTEWTEPENLRAPLNSSGDDFGMTWDNTKPEHGFFTSNRSGGKGNFDIYEFNISPLVIEIEGYVYECAPGTAAGNLSKPLKNSVVTLTNDKDSVKIVVKTDDKGYYGKIKLKEKTNYEISCDNRELYYFDAMPVQRTTKGIKVSTVLKQDFCLKSQIIVQTVPIYYDLDKANIRPDAAKVLDDSILPLLVKYPKLRMELGSHTDCRSSFDYNKDLSQRRADSAVAYLVRKGINKNRLVAFGYGESSPVNDCKCEGAVKSNCSEAEHQKNRRTTIKTLDVNFDPNMKVNESSDPNNKNSAPILVKVEKKDPNFLLQMAGNGVEAGMKSILTAGKDHFIGLNELKNLVAKGTIKPEQLVGITIADIQAGRLKPNATVKLNSLRFGAKDVKTFTAMDVVLKINNSPAPYTIGKDGLTDFGGSLNPEEEELKFTNINKAALDGGPIKANGTDNTTGGTGGASSTTPGTTTAPVKPDTLDLSSAKSIKLMEQGGAKMIPTMVNEKENVNWKYDEASRKIEITEDMAVQLLESGAIKKADFEDGDKIVTKSGKKLPSKSFIIAKLEIGDVVLENVKVTINPNIEEPVMGGQSTVLKKLKAVVKGVYLYLFPKEKKAPKE